MGRAADVLPLLKHSHLAQSTRGERPEIGGPVRLLSVFKAPDTHVHGKSADQTQPKRKEKRREPIETNRIDSNAIQSNPIESNRIESNPIESNRIESNPIQSNRDPNSQCLSLDSRVCIPYTPKNLETTNLQLKHPLVVCPQFVHLLAVYLGPKVLAQEGYDV